MNEFELPPWSEEHEMRMIEETADRAERYERAREINSPGCNHNCTKRWYDDQPLDVKIRIQKRNIFDCKLSGFGVGVRHFEAKLAALLEEKKHGELAGSTECNGAVAGVASQTVR